MKKGLVFLLSIIFLMVSCKPKLVEVVQSLHADGSRQVVYYYQVKKSDSILMEMREFYPSSQKVRIEGSFKDNQKDGLWKSWRKDGKLWSEAEFKNGIHNGINNVYYENGQLFYTGSYKDDERIGIWKFYNESGQLVKEQNYDE